MQNGYQPERAESLQFLTERMANNPRPFYGHPGATWVRMISAPGNVTGRVADLVAQRNSAFGEPLDLKTHLGAYSYLKLYYLGRTELPDDESNGNTPLVSQYEVVYYAWKVFNREHKRTGSAESKQLADLTAKLLEQDRHNSLIDLCWHTIAMAEVDRARFAPKIKANCERILKEQRSDGQWSMQLDPKSASVEFQTGHALYALAIAGFSPDHSAVKKTVDFLLARQQSFGGWFDPHQTYENFRTPFRETQFAVMALSTLYPLERTESQNLAPLTSAAPSSQLHALDYARTAVTASQVAAYLKSPEPMVRALAARRSGRLASPDTVPPLIQALGDSTKLVQRSATIALRSLAARGMGRNAILSALRNSAGRSLTGALRIFAYHTRALTDDPELSAELIRRTTHSSVMVRMSALQTLWQWYWWTQYPETRSRILDAILARLATDEHPWVTRNAREALYNVADENTRYLYNNWIPALAVKADREKAIAAHRALDELVARKLAAALGAGNPRLRLNVLRGLAEFHLRSVRAQTMRYARIGNDVEQIKFSAAAAKILEKPLAACLKDSSPEVRRHAAVASLTLRDNGPLQIALDLLETLTDPHATVRTAASESQRVIPLAVNEATASKVATNVLKLLAAPESESRRTGLELALGSDFLQKSQALSDKLDPFLSDERGTTDALEVIKRSRGARDSVRGTSVLSDALASGKPTHRAAALAIIEKDESIRGAPAVQAALLELSRGTDDTAAVARKLLAAKSASQSATPQLDYKFFSRRVMPVFGRKSALDGLACVSCHFNHNILKVTAPDSAGRFTESQVRESYRAALKVVDLKNAESSLLLQKPMSTSASEGQVNAKLVAHGGGQRWTSPDDPDYQVILAWIKGARDESHSGKSVGVSGPPLDHSFTPHFNTVPIR